MANVSMMQRLGLEIQQLTIMFFSMEKGQKVPTISDLCKKHNLARGTVQSALSFIEQNGAISLSRHGHVGTFVEDIDYKKLISLMTKKNIVGVMPLPYSKRYEGLATGLYTSLNECGINASLAFMRGARNRIDGLISNHYDFVVMSEYSAEKVISENASLQIACSLGKYTYVGNHVLIFHGDDTNIDGMKKVGIDDTSNDQISLTQNFFKGKKIKYVPMIYSQMLSAVQLGKIDAAVWNLDDVGIDASGLKYIDLNLQDTEYKDTIASLVCRADDDFTKTIIEKMLDKTAITKRQELVMNGTLLPTY